jgi:ATP synthase F1 complex assembly factor 2
VRNASERLERRRKHAELLKTAKEIRSAQEAKANPGAARRFWKEVSVREVDGSYHLQIICCNPP